MPIGMTPRQRGLRAVVSSLLCAFAVALIGCGGSGSGSVPIVAAPDQSADFALLTDAVSKSVQVQPGQTTPVTLDLVSANGFPNPVTLTVANVPTGWTTVPATPTVSSLPKGITKIIVNVTAPANAAPSTTLSVGKIRATSGGTTRYLNGSDIPFLGESGDPGIAVTAGDLNVTVAGVDIER